MTTESEDELCIIAIEKRQKEDRLNILPILRNKYPSQMGNEFASVTPIKESPQVPTKLVQEIEIYDPREVMHRDSSENKVIIRRVVKRVPITPPEGFYIVTSRTIETIKEYSFEKWDEVLKDE